MTFDGEDYRKHGRNARPLTERELRERHKPTLDPALLPIDRHPMTYTMRELDTRIVNQSYEAWYTKQLENGTLNEIGPKKWGENS